MQPIAGLLLGLIAALLLLDAGTLRRTNPRLFRLELLTLTAGAYLVAFPDVSQVMAHALGVSRGADLVMYPLLVWLVREALVARQRRWRLDERLALLVRSQALESAQRSSDRRP